MKVFRPACSLAAVLVVLAIPAAAQAQVTLGQLAPNNPPAFCKSDPLDLVPVLVTSGLKYEVPSNGVLTSWSTNAAAGPGQELTFKVLRAFEGVYRVVGHDGRRPLAPSTVNRFRISIPVREGDVLALNDANAAAANNACLFETGDVGDVYGFSQPFTDTPDGGSLLLQETAAGVRLNLQATLLEPPKISAIGTSRGSVTGGTPVTITGVNFAEVQSVTFNDVPAKSFTVNSEGQITAISPAVNALTDAPVKVNTVAGTTTALQSFTYEGCFVPQLKRKRMVEVKRRLAGRDCKLGKVKKLRGASLKTGKVVKQSPNAGGALLAPGTKVNVTLAR